MSALDVLAGRAESSIDHAVAVELLDSLPDHSLDALVTDGPYGIGFMNRPWDNFNPDADAARVERKRRKATSIPPGHGGDISSGGFVEYDLSLEGMRRFQASCEEWARAARRALKPGGHLLAFGSPRTYHRLTSGLEDSGLDVRDSLCWIHASGYPKSLDVERAVAVRTCPQPGRHFWRESSLPKGDDRREGDHVCPVTSESAPFAGDGTALKPAYEPIVMARAPIDGDGTIAHAAMAHGTGRLHVDATRIHTAGSEASAYKRQRLAPGASVLKDGEWKQEAQYQGMTRVGRFPPNLLFSHALGCTPIGERIVPSDGHHPVRRNPFGNYSGVNEGADWRRGEEVVEAWACADGCPVAELDAQGGNLRSGKPGIHRATGEGGYHSVAYGAQSTRGAMTGYGDTGRASRFYPTFAYDLAEDWPGFLYCAKATRAEKEWGLEALAFSTLNRVNAGGLEHDPRWAPQQRKNAHPTVKPTKLIRWLLRLVCHRGGVVCDPFVGSGTTAVAAAAEGMRFIGGDRVLAHAELARARVAGRLGPMFAGVV